MALTTKITEGKVTPTKKTIKLDNILVSQIKLVDIDGIDLTQDFIDAIPEGIDTFSTKVTFEIPDED